MNSPVMPVREPQSAAAVLMVRPARFAFNPETAPSNAFQSRGSATPAGARDLALREFDALAHSLSAAGVAVVVAEDTPEPPKPDAVFPNNWVSFHHDGSVVLYPMLALNRRGERREEVIRQTQSEGGFLATRTIDLCHREAEDKFLEGTGSLVLDRAHRVAYAALSPRTDLDVLGEFAQQLDYELVAFDTADAAGHPVYHTNVMLAIGAAFAVICAEVIGNPAQRAAVIEKLQASGHEIVAISRAQMRQFAGNVLELRPASGPLLALSTRAWAALDAAQRRMLERHARVLPVDIPVIEELGGGGVRCMLAEIHLPKR